MSNTATVDFIASWTGFGIYPPIHSKGEFMRDCFVKSMRWLDRHLIFATLANLVGYWQALGR